MRVGITETKANLEQILELVENGEDVIITRWGKPSARFERVVDLELSDDSGSSSNS